MEKNEQVIHQIRSLAGQFLIRARNPGQGGLHTLFADLLSDAFWAFCDETSGPAFGGGGGRPLGYCLFQTGDPAQARRISFAETACAMKVAGVADRPNREHQGVIVAVWRHRNHMEAISRGFPLAPSSAARAREEGGLSAVQRLAQRRLVHIGERQHLKGVGVLHHGRDQPAALGEVQLGEVDLRDVE
ncbi:hypothetical protein LTR94_031556, partial [Friedmanniomyces endolithicus]